MSSSSSSKSENGSSSSEYEGEEYDGKVPSSYSYSSYVGIVRDDCVNSSS